MELLTYITKTNFQGQKQIDQASLLLYFAYKEGNVTVFTRKLIESYFSDAGHAKQINISRIVKGLVDAEYIRTISGQKGSFELVPIHLQRMAKQYDCLWLGLEYIASDSEVINENRYCGKRDAITKLIKQINCCYAQHCFDACLVLMRRLFEVLLILAYQHHGIEDEIKDDSGNFRMLEVVVGNAKNNKTLKLSRNKQHYDRFRNLGNYSAHNLYYVATIKEIDEIKDDYKAMMDELYDKAGLLS